MNQRAINTDEKSDLLRDNESQLIYFCKDKVDNVILLLNDIEKFSIKIKEIFKRS